MLKNDRITQRQAMIRCVASNRPSVLVYQRNNADTLVFYSKFFVMLRFMLIFCLALLQMLLHTHCERSVIEQPVNPIDTTSSPREQIDILALGDSYTKGESVKWEENFPNQLKDSLLGLQYQVTGIRNIAKTGWRTDQLQFAIANQNQDIADSIFSLVTLCIGVNNQYQNANFETYKTQFSELLQTAIQRAGGRKERVIVVSIPDWAYTPYGQNFSNPNQISQKIDQYNAANRAITEAQGVAYVNVTDISREGLARPDLVATDGLHPAAKQYTEWVRLILPQAQKALAK
jgi:acyl-CoA thioesterase I